MPRRRPGYRPRKGRRPFVIVLVRGTSEPLTRYIAEGLATFLDEADFSFEMADSGQHQMLMVVKYKDRVLTEVEHEVDPARLEQDRSEVR